MFLVAYLVVAAVRLFISPLDPKHRLRAFYYRLLVALFGMAAAVPVQVICQQLQLDGKIAVLIEVAIVISVGEHMIYSDLQRRQMLPANAPRIPLGY